LNAALKLFSTHGFAATRLDDVAAVAGITKGTIYLYFKSKEDLLEEVVRRWTPPTVDYAALATATPPDAETALRETVASLFATFADPDLRRLLRLVIAEGDRAPYLPEQYYHAFLEPGAAALSDVIKHGVRTGAFRDSGLEEYPQLILGPMIAGALWESLFGKSGPLDLEALCEQLTEQLLHALRAPEHPDWPAPK
jgi:AcrR family transcriptional regulator